MATQRYISTSFWDDEWVQGLTPDEKLFYIYLLTNPLTNIAGVYKISDRRIKFDTSLEGIDTLWIRLGEVSVDHVFPRVARFGEWVIITNWPSHQKWKTRSKIKTGIEAILCELPKAVLERVREIGYQYPMHTLSIPYAYPTNYSDSDSDLDTDTDTDTDTEAPAVDTFEEFWSHYPRKERKAETKDLYVSSAGSVEERLSSVKTYAAIIKRDQPETKYIMLPTTFFAQGRWLDYVDMKPNGTGGRYAEWQCAECGKKHTNTSDFCPICGKNRFENGGER